DRLEGKIVAEQDEAMLVRGTQVRKEMRKRSDVFAMNLDELEALHYAMHRLDQRALAHAACAPQQRIVGRKPAGETLCVGEQRIAHAVDALEQREGHAVDIGNRNEASRLGMPGEGVACREVRRFGLLRAKALDGPSDPFEHTRERFLKVHIAPVAKAGELAIVAPPSRDKRRSEEDKGPRLGRGRPSLSLAKDRSNDRFRQR